LAQTEDGDHRMNESLILDERLERSLRAAHEVLGQRDELLPPDRLQECYAVFRDRFGPERLRSLDGDVLLNTMHASGTKESLSYWLEFKNDEEFSGIRFGGIAGGSAHKFGLFRRKETGLWIAGSSQNEVNVSEADAIAIARNHRDQLLAGVALLERLPENPEDADYGAFQQELGLAAPELCKLGWSHKYFFLLFPTKLDDYHNERYQRFHLIKMLQNPPEQEGLYVCAGRFVRLAAHLGWPIPHLTSALNELNGGRPTNYWRIGTRIGENYIWEAMRDGGYAAIGWDFLGDLTGLIGPEFKESIRLKLQPHYPADARTASRKAGEIFNFVTRIEDGDLAIAADGEQVLGVGRVGGPYLFENTEPTAAPHRRRVDWLSASEEKLSEGLQTTVSSVKKVENLLKIERLFLDDRKIHEIKRSPVIVPLAQRLEGIPGRIQAILERKGQVILYGPPGTGKTYWACRVAMDLAAISAFRRIFDDLNAEEKDEIQGKATESGLVRFCTFHPGYGYEDFLEGYRPELSREGRLTFQLRDGIFKRLCRDASRTPERNFLLLIDEINRGDIPRIFGELLTQLELDKRGMKVSLPLSGEVFAVPRNVHVIGTMNTADRSIALLDTALRRRFGFLELMPDTTVFGKASAGGDLPLGPWLKALNEHIRKHIGRDARNLQVGHAYLLEHGNPVIDFALFVRILAEDIVPLLQEYCYEDYDALAKILGMGLVDKEGQRIRDELFSPARREELVQELLASAPEIATSLDAVNDSKSADEIEDPIEPENEKP
jgi:5-methylcytosine-specific restriction enzyme B